MTPSDEYVESASPMPKLPIAAAVVALAGLADSVYLTVKHIAAEPVPCSIISGCETVLTSTYAEIAGVPLAAFGAAAYFAAFALALLAALPAGVRDRSFLPVLPAFRTYLACDVHHRPLLALLAAVSHRPLRITQRLKPKKHRSRI